VGPFTTLPGWPFAGFSTSFQSVISVTTKVQHALPSGRSWQSATLGEDIGRFAFRTWSFPLKAKGKVTVMARASNAIGQTQTSVLNPAGYHHNVVHSISLTVA
jgi:sulfite dehydrogenase (cytochrome) subunit A